MLVIKKISFVILILSVSFFKLNAKDLNSLFDDLQKAENIYAAEYVEKNICLLYTSPSPRDATLSRMPSSA